MAADNVSVVLSFNCWRNSKRVHLSAQVFDCMCSASPDVPAVESVRALYRPVDMLALMFVVCAVYRLVAICKLVRIIDYQYDIDNALANTIKAAAEAQSQLTKVSALAPYSALFYATNGSSFTQYS